MPTWISLKKATLKYGVEEADILLWVAEKEIVSARHGKILMVDDESILELWYRCRTLPTREYIEALKQRLEEQIALCEVCTELLDMQNAEIEIMGKQITLLEEINKIRTEQDKRILEITQRK